MILNLIHISIGIILFVLSFVLLFYAAYKLVMLIFEAAKGAAGKEEENE